MRHRRRNWGVHWRFSQSMPANQRLGYLEARWPNVRTSGGQGIGRISVSHRYPARARGENEAKQSSSSELRRRPH
jgi:hypothetical protein